MKTGVILARFQPIHNGHLALIKQAVAENEQVLIIIGSIDKLSQRNPIP
jgi:bifunctional NMN adenylyltransferase/nudix hydrolase